MYEKNGYKVLPWDPNKGEDWKYAKKAILEILNSQNVSLSKVNEIEDENNINL